MEPETNTAPEADTPEMEAAKKAALMEEGATEATPTGEDAPTMVDASPEASPAPEATPEM